jgi:AraC-like DNA-binding protein
VATCRFAPDERHGFSRAPFTPQHVHGRRAADAELKRQPEAIGSLIGLLAIPAISPEGEARQVIAALLDMLLAALRELDRKVAQRTRELRATNIELERALGQIDELKAKLQLQDATLREAVSIQRGGLAPWQARRAKELMDANLGGKLPLSQLAEACGLSTRHFARAFRQSTGVPPHRWRLSRRLERAKDLLRDPARSLSEVALACGFADQSHFTRMFTTLVGLSPGLWRRTLSRKLPLGIAGEDPYGEGESAHCPHRDFTSPPSIRTPESVSHRAPGETRKAMSSAISSGVP